MDLIRTAVFVAVITGVSSVMSATFRTDKCVVCEPDVHKIYVEKETLAVNNTITFDWDNGVVKIDGVKRYEVLERPRSWTRKKKHKYCVVGLFDENYLEKTYTKIIEYDNGHKMVIIVNDKVSYKYRVAE